MNRSVILIPVCISSVLADDRIDISRNNIILYFFVFILLVAGIYLIWHTIIVYTSENISKENELEEKIDKEKLKVLKKDVSWIKIDKQPFRLSGMLHILTNKIGEEIKQNRHVLYYDIDKKLKRYIVGDNDYLEQILEILCRHLIALNTDSEIVLRLSKEGRYLVFELYNEKAVLSKKEVEKLNSLVQLSENMSEYANTYVKAKKIAISMAGRLTLESYRKGGTSYRLEIPFHQDRDEQSNQNILKEKIEGKSVLFIGKTKNEIKRIEYIFHTFGLNIEHMHSNEFENKRPDISKFDMVVLHSSDLLPKQISFFKKLKEKREDSLQIIIIHELFESEARIEVSKSIADAEIWKPIIIGDVEEILYQIYILQSKAVKGINNVEIFDPAVFKIRGRRRITKKDISKFAGAYIAVAEDSKVDQRIMRNILAHEGLKVFFVENGQEMLELLEKEPIDMIFSDINMPMMDGLLMTKKIRQNKLWKDIPIVSISSMAFGHEVKAMQVAGMNAAITKPIISEEVYEAMERFLTVLPKWNSASSSGLKHIEKIPHHDPKILNVRQALCKYANSDAYEKVLLESRTAIKNSTDQFTKLILGEKYKALPEYINSILPLYKKIHAPEMEKMLNEVLDYLSQKNRSHVMEYAILYKKNLKALLLEIDQYLAK